MLAIVPRVATPRSALAAILGACEALREREFSVSTSLLRYNFLLYAICSRYRIKGKMVARLSIGELSRRTGVNIETIRYFERVGLISSPSRTEGGHRVYDQDHLRALGFIRRARELGFTPEEVRGILKLGGPADACCDEVREIASKHLQTVRSKMADLARLERLLASTLDRCSGDHAPQCAVIDMIEDSAAPVRG
jgi:MerR family transcriptional regulator, mercuric resistance operon regulatory protein